MKAAKSKQKLAGIVGLGLDGDDGHTRITKAENFVLLGGSADTHAQMQETAVKVNEQLTRRGKRLEDTSVRELREIFADVQR